MGLRWRSWHAVLPGVSLVVLLVAVHFFVAPLVPATFSGDLLFHRINGGDVERALKCIEEERGAVIFRKATWKADVGCWLSLCGNPEPVPVVEVSEHSFILCTLIRSKIAP